MLINWPICWFYSISSTKSTFLQRKFAVIWKARTASSRESFLRITAIVRAGNHSWFDHLEALRTFWGASRKWVKPFPTCFLNLKLYHHESSLVWWCWGSLKSFLITMPCRSSLDLLKSGQSTSSRMPASSLVKEYFGYWVVTTDPVLTPLRSSWPTAQRYQSINHIFRGVQDYVCQNLQ